MLQLKRQLFGDLFGLAPIAMVGQEQAVEEEAARIFFVHKNCLAIFESVLQKDYSIFMPSHSP